MTASRFPQLVWSVTVALDVACTPTLKQKPLGVARLRSREAASFFASLAGTPGQLDLVLSATVSYEKANQTECKQITCRNSLNLQSPSATQEYKEGDYLTVHSDMKPGEKANGAGGSRRLTFVLSLSSDEWPVECGGAHQTICVEVVFETFLPDTNAAGRFVWCRPAAAVAPTSNSLTLFLTSPWSTHLVEPVWSGRGCGAMPFALLYGSLLVRTVQTQPSIMADRWRQVRRMAYIGSRGQVSPVSSGNTQVCVGGAAKTWKHSRFGVCT